MPTITDCPDTCSPTHSISFHRSDKPAWRGTKVLKKPATTQNTEIFQYNWSEEPQGRYQATNYTPLFLPRIRDCIVQCYNDLESRKTRNVLIGAVCTSMKDYRRGYEAPSKPLHRGYTAPAHPLDRGYQGGA